MGLVAPRHVESSQSRDQTHVPCIGRVLNYFTTRGSLKGFFFKLIYFISGCLVSSLLRELFSSGAEKVLLSSVWASHSHCGGFSCFGPQALGHMGFSSWDHGLSNAGTRLKNIGSVVMVHRFSCSGAYGIFLDQGSNPCLLHWKADSLPLNH